MDALTPESELRLREELEQQIKFAVPWRRIVWQPRLAGFGNG
jgi:hypothetical protein